MSSQANNPVTATDPRLESIGDAVTLLRKSIKRCGSSAKWTRFTIRHAAALVRTAVQRGPYCSHADAAIDESLCVIERMAGTFEEQDRVYVLMFVSAIEKICEHAEENL
jgi:hypothetical protein